MKYTKITISINSTDKPPFFMGSQLRGVLGYALKKVVCVNPTYKCEDCFTKENCLFYDFYEKKNVFHKYRFDITLKSDSYDFSFYLFNEACEKLPYILSAFHKSLTSLGLGKNKKKYKDFKIYINDELSYEDEEFFISDDYIKEFKVTQYSSSIILNLITPLRIKNNNKLIKNDSLDLIDILSSVYKRKESLNNKQFTKMDYDYKFEILNKTLIKQELTRHSNKQNKKMYFDGLVGSMVITNLDKTSYELLKLGELISAGKQTVFGLGKLEVKEIE